MMLQDDVDKMQKDLDAVRDALGCELPFGRDDIRLSLVGAVAAGFWCVWTLLVKGYWLVLVGAMPMVLVAIGGSFWLWRRWQARRKEQPLAARRNALSIRMSVVFVLAMIGFCLVGWKMGFAIHMWKVMVLCFGAVICLLFGMMGKVHRRSLSLALGFVAMALLVYFLYDDPAVAAGDSPAIPAVAAVIVLTLLADAGIMYVQLKGNRGACPSTGEQQESR